MENDEIYTMERGSYLLVRINDNGDDANYDGNDVCRRVTNICQELFWQASCINSFYPHSLKDES